MRPEHGIARVLRNDRPVGLAFTVGQRLMLTCAHVINSALGRDLREPSPPGDQDLLLDFPFGGIPGDRPVRSAVVASWLPHSGPFDLRDLALLRIREGLPLGVPTLTLAAGSPVGSVQMWGPSPDRPTGGHVIGRAQGEVEPGRLQIDQELHGIYRVRFGFSGGPVWRPESLEVVGVLQAASTEDHASDAYLLQVNVIPQSWIAESEPDRTLRNETGDASEANVSVMEVANAEFLARIRRAGLVDIENRGDIRNSMPPTQFLRSAGSEILLTGITAKGSFSDFFGEIDAAVARGVKLYVMVMNPRSREVLRLEENNNVDIRHDIEDVTRRIRNSFGDSELVQLRYMSRIPPFTAIMIEGDLIMDHRTPRDRHGQVRIQPGALHLTQHRGIILQFRKNDDAVRGADALTAFDFFAIELRNQWRTAQPADDLGSNLD